MKNKLILPVVLFSAFIAWQPANSSDLLLKSTKFHLTTTSKHVAQKVPKQRQVDKGGFPVELQSCQRSGTIVTCSILITNVGDENLPIIFRDPVFYNDNIPKAFDSSGEQYHPQEIQVGKETTRGRFGLGYTLNRNIPTKIRILFKVPKQINIFSSLVIEYDMGNSLTKQYFGSITFQNVNIVNSSIK
jgi:hypothetical protein